MPAREYVGQSGAGSSDLAPRQLPRLRLGAEILPEEVDTASRHDYRASSPRGAASSGSQPGQTEPTISTRRRAETSSGGVSRHSHAGDALLDNGREDAQKLVRAFDVNGAFPRESAPRTTLNTFNA